MILKALTGKAAPYIVAGVGVLILSLIGTIAWLMNSRDGLLEQNAAQRQALSNAAHANRENLSTIRAQQDELEWRSHKAMERQQRSRTLASELAETHAELQEALTDAPECMDQPWPDAVFDIMRRDTVSDPNRDGERAGAG